MGGIFGSMAGLVLGAIIGAMGARIGKQFGVPTLFGAVSIWLAFCVVPLLLCKAFKPAWRFLAYIGVGAAYLTLLHWHIDRRDLGEFFPWSLSALAFGIVLGTFLEPIRLARGGSTEGYASRGVMVGGGFMAYGNRNALFLAVGFVLGFAADIVSLGRQRVGATIGGLLGGAISAFAFSVILASFCDSGAAYLFFGSVWNITRAGTVLGAISGAASGFLTALIREQQERIRLHLFASTPDRLPDWVDFYYLPKFREPGRREAERRCVISVTPTAAVEIGRAAKGMQSWRVRVRLEVFRDSSGMPKEFRNRIDLDSKIYPEIDLIDESQGVPVVVDRRSADHLEGYIFGLGQGNRWDFMLAIGGVKNNQ
jgi:hypothetical protein